jgi:hypothetical protein
MSNGAFFIFRKKTFIKYKNRIGKNPFYYELDFPESIEIDNKEDLYLARKICSIIDVTLRDGGHAKDFDWPLVYAKDHYKNMCKIPEVKFIELGYWKQISKSKNIFYNLN